jgi:hypothetical protein
VHALIRRWVADAVPSLQTTVQLPTIAREVKLLRECVGRANAEIESGQQKSLKKAPKELAVFKRAAVLFNAMVREPGTLSPEPGTLYPDSQTLSDETRISCLTQQYPIRGGVLE